MSRRVVIVTALTAERVALAGRCGDAVIVRTGMGPDRARKAIPVVDAGDARAVIVAGVAGGLDPAVKPGDVIVATSVRDDRGTITLPDATLLVSQLRTTGVTVHTGQILTTDTVVREDRRGELAGSGALAVDMESAPMVRHLRAMEDPPVMAVVRVVADAVGAPLVSPRTLVTGTRALATLRRIGPALAAWGLLAQPRTVVLAGPRSFCAGVERAIDIVTRALQIYPHPVYVRRQIVHNEHVVADLSSRGAVFVQELHEVPDGSTVIFSAHGVAPAVRTEADRRGLTVVDATCPLVAKVHSEVRRFLAKGDTVLLIGHPHHDETEGTLGEGDIRLVENVEQARALTVDDPAHVAVVTQTTLAVSEAAEVIDGLRERMPLLSVPASDDICYATTNRQNAVQVVAAESDLVLVVGSETSSNSVRLVEVAQRAGTRAHLIDDANAITPALLRGAARIGITAGASAPPELVDEVLAAIAALGPIEVEERTVAKESVTFTLPKEVGG